MSGSSRVDNTRRIAAALLLLVFSAGALTAAAVSSLGPDAASENPGPDAVSVGLEGLGLSEGQRRTIDAIVAERQPAVDSIVYKALADLQVVMADVDADVRAVLSPEQLVLYDSLKAEAPRIRAVQRTSSIDGGPPTVDTLTVDVP